MRASDRIKILVLPLRTPSRIVFAAWSGIVRAMRSNSSLDPA